MCKHALALPAMDFTLTMVDSHRAVLFGGYETDLNRSQHVYILDVQKMVTEQCYLGGMRLILTDPSMCTYWMCRKWSQSSAVWETDLNRSHYSFTTCVGKIFFNAFCTYIGNCCWHKYEHKHTSKGASQPGAFWIKWSTEKMVTEQCCLGGMGVIIQILPACVHTGSAENELNYTAIVLLAAPCNDFTLTMVDSHRAVLFGVT